MRLPKNEEEKLRLMSREDKSKAYSELTSTIVNSSNKQQLIVSGPGTGKTTIFGGKIDKWNKDGIPHEEILITSFINFIVDDLNSSLPENCSVYTLHKYAKILIHKYLGTGSNFGDSPLTQDFSIAWECDITNISDDLISLESLQEEPKKISFSIGKYFQILQNKYKPAYLETYLKLVSFYDVITFEDSIVRAYKAITRKKDIFKFKKVIVDEYQDFNPAEQAFVKLFFDYSDGGIIAGDDDQSIYSSKHAKPSGLLSLIDSEDWEKHSIPFCGRCKSQHVVNASINAARQQKSEERKDKSFIPLHEDDNKIQVVTLKKSMSSKDESKHFLAEAEYIGSKIDLNEVKNWDKNYPAYLILGRTGTHLKRIAQELQKKIDIQIGMREQSVYSDHEVQILFSFIQLLRNERSNVAYRRLLGIFDKKTVSKIVKKAIEKGGFQDLEEYDSIKKIKSLLEDVKKVNIEERSLEEILWDYIKTLGLNKESELLKKYVDLIKSQASIEKVLRHTEDSVVEEKEQERKAIVSSPIQFLTIWGSKGLKAENVFMLGLEEGYLPKSNEKFEDEEVRLFYVGMTRAVKELHLLTCSIRYDGVHSELGGAEGFKKRSIFLSWLPSGTFDEITLGKNDIKN